VRPRSNVCPTMSILWTMRPCLPLCLTALLNQTHGRRFKVVSFRWLTRSDI